MRDVSLARRQFYAGLGFLTITAGMAYFLLWPQYRQYQLYKSHHLAQLIIRSPMFSQLPVLEHLNAVDFAQRITRPVREMAQAAHVEVMAVETTLSHAAPMENMPNQVTTIPVQIRINGSFPEIQNFLSALFQKFPHATVQALRIQAVPPPNGSEPVSAGRESVLLKLDMVVETG